MEQGKIDQELGADGRPSDIEKEVDIPYPFDADKISISNRTVPIQSLIRRLKQGTITSPLIQRGAGIWDDEQQSRLIESLLLKIPLPLFYVAADENENWSVVDGLQRVTAIRRFVIDEEFTLRGLEFLKKEFNGYGFNDLPQKMQNRIFETELTFAIIDPVTPQNVQRNVFKRLNTGGLPLTSQEIRHALYYGNSAVLLEKLAHSGYFKTATDNRVDDSRMGARELILRFLAFYVRGVESYPKNDDMDAFLSETMQIINSMPELLERDLARIFGEDQSKTVVIKYRDEQILVKKFEIAMIRAYKLFGVYAFRKSTPLDGYRTPINKSLFEVWSCILAEIPQQTFDILLEKKKILFTKIRSKMNEINSSLERSISSDSHKMSGVKSRYKLINDIIIEVIEEEDL